ncbi:DUF805 domain-containing protein [Parasaccharibacter apium]|uniref:DUF805 domain-containing protein n=1 Tax=Parasaccharibacter apium TaxID=1510841 RepID=A0ABX4ZPN1_9PROT|nr:hypothetical protein ASO19_06990 [Parasaccharibacter apium]POS65136.1 hypothetical protein ASQ42_00565 [Parasaccharibacter apium]POS66199.1 hypothetical protein ASQ43_00685 [Parasaccharibacter apium]
MTFSGRATCPEYWYFRLFEFIFYFVIEIIDSISGSIFPWLVVYILMFLPGIAVGMRRLHDTGRSGWWVWLPSASFSVIVVYHASFLYKLNPSGGHLSPLVFLPIIPFLLCPIATLIFLCQPGTPGNNRFGPPPGNGRG